MSVAGSGPCGPKLETLANRRAGQPIRIDATRRVVLNPMFNPVIHRTVCRWRRRGQTTGTYGRSCWRKANKERESWQVFGEVIQVSFSLWWVG